MPPQDLSLQDARRIALAAQGLDRPRPKRRAGPDDLRRVIQRLGLLQIDYVNVLLPAQYQVPFSRLGPYDRASLDTLVYRAPEREFTEMWAREASIVPIAHWPLLRYRMDQQDRRYRAFTQFLDKYPAYSMAMLEEIRKRGPLAASELPEVDGSRGRSSGFWGWSQARCVVEALFMRGQVSVTDRRGSNNARICDITERVIPRELLDRVVDRGEAMRELLRIAARAHGVGTAGDFADYFRMRIRDAQRHVAELVEAGDLREVRVEGWREAAWLHKDAEAATGSGGGRRSPSSRLSRRSRPEPAAALLSPFDPLVWHRGRVARLFDFDYVLEIWVPAAKRRWGYYVLPFLFEERLAARVDLKADREAGVLRVIASYLEPHARTNREAVAHALAVELNTMAAWLGLSGVAIGRRGDFARTLGAAARSVR
jgi:uncharacterized protein YcaQ